MTQGRHRRGPLLAFLHSHSLSLAALGILASWTVSADRRLVLELLASVEGGSMSVEELRKNEMMSHLLGALDRGEDIGHYGRLVFAMIARHFLPREELVAWLRKNPEFPEQEARALVHQVEEKDYSPPTRERILEWQAHQIFPICPNPKDPDAGNVYKDLHFPDKVYDHITEYHEKKTEAEP